MAWSSRFGQVFLKSLLSRFDDGVDDSPVVCSSDGRADDSSLSSSEQAEGSCSRQYARFGDKFGNAEKRVFALTVR